MCYHQCHSPTIKIDKKTGDEWLAKYMDFLRTLVEMIEAGGGASGGQA
jgi:hypothetical protein